MDRRKFIKGLVAGVATVAIATKLAPKFPTYEYKTYDIGFSITREEIEDSYVNIGRRMHEALAKSMMEMKEQAAMRIFVSEDWERDVIHVEGISREEFYRDG